MVRSYRRGTLIAVLACGGLALAWVGLARSQAPRGTQTVSAQPERILTVYENGKGLRCRVVTTWRLQDGSAAYQVQVVDTGETMTIVEDGPATTVDGRQGRMRALSTKIFHWARNTPPPPDTLLPCPPTPPPPRPPPATPRTLLAPAPSPRRAAAPPRHRPRRSVSLPPRRPASCPARPGAPDVPGGARRHRPGMGRTSIAVAHGRTPAAAQPPAVHGGLSESRLHRRRL